MSRRREDIGYAWSSEPGPWYGFGPAALPAGDAPILRSRAPGRVDEGGLYIGIAVSILFFVAGFVDVTGSGPAAVFLFALLLATGSFTAFLRPRWFPAVVLAYFPFSMRYPFALGAGINMVNLLMVLGLVALVSHREQSRRRYRFHTFELLLLLFLALGFAGFVRGYLSTRDFGEALTNYKRWATPPLFFFLIRALIEERRDIARLIKVMAFTTAVAAALTWWNAIEKGPRSSIEASRVSGIFNGPNEMGTFLVYSSMMMLAVVVWRTSAGKKLIYLGGFLLAARAMLFTFSRGAYVSLAAGSILIVLLRNPLYLAGAAVLGTAAVAVDPGLIPESVVIRLAQTTRESAGSDLDEADLDKSVSHRFVLWRAARRIIEDYPLGGVGLGRFPHYVDAYVERPLKPSEVRDVHNAYLLVATELGLPALLVMVALLVLLFVSCLRLYFARRHGFDRMVALGAAGSVLSLSCTLVLGSRFTDENYIGYFWTLAAFIMVLQHFRDLPRAVVAEAKGSGVAA